jgi:hypothetical protein
MKQITTAILIFSITLLKAQTNPATPNASFADWTHYEPSGEQAYDVPNSWYSINSTTDVFGTITCYKDSTTPLPGDRYAVILLTQLVASIEVAPGALTTGTFNTVSQTISGGLPYILRPDSIIGWYKYSSVSGDNGDCEFYLFGATHTDTIGQAFFKTPTSSVSNWTRFSLAITYTSSATPDTALWIFSSSNAQASAQVGSELYVDSLGLIFDSSTGIKSITDAEDIIVGPNPTNGLVSVNNSSNSKSLVFSLVDIMGRKVEVEKLAPGISYLELESVSDGMYMYYIQNEHNAIIKTGKIVVQK